MSLSPEERMAIMQVIEEKQGAIGEGIEARRKEDLITYKHYLDMMKKEPTEFELFERDPEKYKKFQIARRGIPPEDDVTPDVKPEDRRKQIMNLRDEYNLIARSIEARLGKMTRDELEDKATTMPTARDIRIFPGLLGEQKLHQANYRRIIDREKELNEILKQIKRLNRGLPPEQQIDIETEIGEPEMTVYKSAAEVRAAFTRGEIDEETALRILREQFGME